jgi:Zn-dependent oligopeptidase
MEVSTSRTKGNAVPKNLSVPVTCLVCGNAFPAGSYNSMLTSSDASTQI